MKTDINDEQTYQQVCEEIALLREWIATTITTSVNKQVRNDLHQAIESLCTLARATAVYEYRQSQTSSQN